MRTLDFKTPKTLAFTTYVPGKRSAILMDGSKKDTFELFTNPRIHTIETCGKYFKSIQCPITPFAAKYQFSTKHLAYGSSLCRN